MCPNPPVRLQRLGALAAAMLVSSGAGCGTAGEGGATSGPSPSPTATQALPEPPPVLIGDDGYFYLDGQKTIVFGVEEEHHHYTPAELDALVPRLQEMGVNLVVLYVGNPQEDFFYEKLEAEEIWIAQDLGNVKKRTQSPFPNTGGVIGTIPDEAVIQQNLAQIDEVVVRVSRFQNILFWWMGGEFVEPEFHSPAGTGATRDSIARYLEAVHALDPLRRPFTVSHHYAEAIEDPLLPFVDLTDVTDFSWFTVATHFHSGDFVTGAGWWPIAQVSEHGAILEPILRDAHALSHHKPIFFGGVYAQAPIAGECIASAQEDLLRDKWNAISGVPHLGGSTYHLSGWNGNGIPHALFEQTGGDWVPTPAGKALREIILTSP